MKSRTFVAMQTIHWSGLACSSNSLVPTLFLYLLSGLSALAQNPDPRVLLHGIEASRNAIRFGSLECVMRSTRADRPHVNTSTLFVEFDGAKITCREKKRIVVVNEMGEKGRRALDKLKAMNYDHEAFVKAGLGKFQDEELRLGWDGAKLCRYTTSGGGAAFIDPKKGIGALIFNPRILGISMNYLFADSVASLLKIDKAESILLIGKESVNGRDLWHVQQKRKNIINQPLIIDYWMESGKNFRVHKILIGERGGETVILSEFDKQDSVLPSKVITKAYLQPGDRLQAESTLTVKKMDIETPVSSNVGTLASLEIPYGQAVDDYIAKRRLGYSTGRDEDLSKSPPLKKEHVIPARSKLIPRVLIIILFGLVIMWMIRKWRAARINVR